VEFKCTQGRRLAVGAGGKNRTETVKACCRSCGNKKAGRQKQGIWNWVCVEQSSSQQICATLAFYSCLLQIYPEVMD